MKFCDNEKESKENCAQPTVPSAVRSSFQNVVSSASFCSAFVGMDEENQTNKTLFLFWLAGLLLY